MSGVTLSREGPIQVPCLSAPPVNALSRAVRQGLWDGVDRALADDAVKGILIEGTGRSFSVGANIRELGRPEAPGLGELCTFIENSPKPVLALIHGQTLGGGLELALAAHYRMAVPGAQIGLPEIKLGLLPGAGGTQRLPRLTGADAALEMMVSGKSVSAAQAVDLKIVDRFAGDDPHADARNWLLQIIDKAPGPRPASRFQGCGGLSKRLQYLDRGA